MKGKRIFITTLALIFLVLGVLNVSAGNDYSNINNLWWFDDNVSGINITDSGSRGNNLIPVSSPEIWTNGCYGNYTRCGHTDGSANTMFRTNTQIVTNDKNQTWWVLFKPTQAEATFDVFAGANDGWYLNDNGNNIQANTKDGTGYDAVNAVVTYDTTNSTWYFLYSHVFNHCCSCNCKLNQS